MLNNIQTIIDKSRSIGEGRVRFIATRQELEDFLKDSLTSMLDSIQEEMLYRGGLFEENETLKDRGAYNQAVERDRLIINSHR